MALQWFCLLLRKLPNVNSQQRFCPIWKRILFDEVNITFTAGTAME